VALIEDVRQVASGWRWTRRPLAPRSAEPDPEPFDEPEFPTDWARTPAARAVRELVLAGVFRPLVWNQTSVRVDGLDRLEDLDPPVVFVANHSSHVDTPVLLCSLPKRWRERTAVGAAADYFFDIWWRAATTALAFNTFPIERTGGSRATSTARRLLDDGWNLMVFPEGTRSKDGWLGPWRHGAARLCCELGAPAVPVAIRGSFAAMPRGRSWPRPGRPPVRIRYGPPLAPEPGEEYHLFSVRVRDALARVADEDATDWYASLRREANGETPAMHGPDAPAWRRVWEGTRPPLGAGARRVWRRASGSRTRAKGR
jgi:1-acyl-sn-glycerol-3-phosphate acyltransferase